MDHLRFADNLDSEPVIALGLPASRLILAGLGAAATWAVCNSALPTLLRIVVAGLMALTISVLAWGRHQEVSLARWFWLFLGFAARAMMQSRDHHQWVGAESRCADRPGADAPTPGRSPLGFLPFWRCVRCSRGCWLAATQITDETSDTPSVPGELAAGSTSLGPPLGPGTPVNLSGAAPPPTVAVRSLVWQAPESSKPS